MIILITFLVTFVFLLILTKTELSKFAEDLPNHRSLHQVVTPRTGGLAMALGLLPSVVSVSVTSWVILVYLLIVISIWDDRFEIRAGWRFLAHITVAVCFVFTYVHNAFLVQVFFVLSLVWVTNLYNFMDGSDGLAGGMTMFGFSIYAVGFGRAEINEFAILCACIVSASSAFLLFNFHPAKIFMGDAGSIPLGFLAGSLGIYGWHLHIWPFWFPVLVFSPFIVDATVTLIKRLLRREKVWQAHREHYYQRLIQLGWGHRKTALYEYVVMLGCSISALIGLRFPQWSGLLLGAWFVIYILVALWIDKQWKMNLQNNLG